MSTTTSIEHFAPIVVDDSAGNRLDDIRNLNKSDSHPDPPDGKGLVIAEGTLIVPRLVRSRFPLRTVFGTRRKLVPSVDGLTASEAAIAETVSWFELDRGVLIAAAGPDLHRGLLTTVGRVPGLSVDQVLSGVTTLAVMGGVGDHESIGALFRNVAGMGADGVILGAACVDPLYRRSVRVSMGHVLTVPFAILSGITTTWQRSPDQLKEQGFRVVSMTPVGMVDLWDAMDTDRTAIFVSTEGPGLTEHAMAATDVRARTPTPPGTDSLNVATSAAIAFYERLRVQLQRVGQQRLFPELVSRLLPGAASEVLSLSPKVTELLQRVSVRLCITNPVVVVSAVNLYAKLGGARLTY